MNMFTTDRLAGKVVLITGAGRGIGRSIALELARAGTRLGLLSRSEGPLMELAAEVAAVGAECLTFTGDVTNRADVRAAVLGLKERYERIDILVNNAGVGYYAPIAQLTEEQLDQMWNVNAKGALIAVQEVLPLMVEQQDGQIVCVSSLRALEVVETSAGYSASKAALMAMIAGVQKEHGRHGIRATAVCPGGVRSDFAGQSAGGKPNFWLTPEDVADMVCYTLCAPPHVLVDRIVAYPFQR